MMTGTLAHPTLITPNNSSNFNNTIVGVDLEISVFNNPYFSFIVCSLIKLIVFFLLYKTYTLMKAYFV